MTDTHPGEAAHANGLPIAATLGALGIVYGDIGTSPHGVISVADLKPFNFSTVLMAVHKDCYTSLNLTQQCGLRRRETIAMASAVLKPMPRISRASRYGFSVMTWMASEP